LSSGFSKIIINYLLRKREAGLGLLRQNLVLKFTNTVKYWKTGRAANRKRAVQMKRAFVRLFSHSLSSLLPVFCGTLCGSSQVNFAYSLRLVGLPRLSSWFTFISRTTERPCGQVSLSVRFFLVLRRHLATIAREEFLSSPSGISITY